jgi:hypothetical protein
MLKTLIFSLILLAQQTTGASLALRVLDANQEPISGMEITLALYTYEGQEATIWFEDHCQTDSDGRCLFQIENAPPDGGFLRGTLQIGDFGLRDVTWPGGELKLTVPTDQIGFGREAVPYEFQKKDGGVETVQSDRLPLYTLLVAVLLAGLVFVVYREAQKEHA